MADIVPSLFGLTPEMYQQAQSAQADKAASDFAQMTPFQKASFGIGRGAYQLAGALGGEDPQLQLISQRNAIARQINYNDLASIQQGVQKLAEFDPVGAMQLAEVSRRLESEQAQTFQRQSAGMASLAQATREKTQATPEKIQLAREFAAQVGAPGSPEYNAEYNTQLRRLTTQEGKEPEKLVLARELAARKGAPGSPEYEAEYTLQLTRLTGKETTPNVKEVGVAEGTRKPVYIDVNTDQQFVYDTDAAGKQVRKPYVGGVDRTTAKISATSQNIQENEFSKQLGGAQGKRYEGAVGLRDNAIASINTFEALSRLDDQGLISGSFANGRVGATNLLNTLGLVSPDVSEKLARSENYQKIAGDAILATLGGKLGAGFSNEDRKFIQSLVPQLENSPTARRQLIDYMLRKNRAIVGETTRLIDFAENKRTLNGYVPEVPLPGMPTTTTPAATGGWSIKPVK